MEPPVIKEKKGISPIWILPLVALSIGAWLLYTSYRDAGISVTIHFDNAEGITPNKTQVMYKGVAVGVVERIYVDENLQGVSLRLKIDKKAKRGLVEDTKFWIVRPEISAGRISGLATILTGSYLAMQPGKSSVFTTQFEGLPEPPVIPPDSPGLHITLKADALNSLQKGSPVYTKNVQIGVIKGYRLTDDNYILIDIYIEPQFSHLIQVGTRFWNSSGITFEGNLQAGFNLKMESLASLIYGGISCGTPESLLDKSIQAVNGMVYQLYNSFDAAEYGLNMSLQLASGGGIIEGKTKIMYRGLEAGVVKKITLNNDAHHTVTAEILLDPRAEPILREGTRFWVIRPEVSIDGVHNLETIISGPYITFQPGEGEYRDHFIVEEGRMPKIISRSGKHFSLISPDSGSLEEGAPILYKKMVVGEITAVAFDPSVDAILTDILVYEEFSSLVKKSSVFWNISGIEVDASLSHFNLNLASLRTLLAGGIAFTNPETEKGAKVPPAEDGASFTLFGSFADAIENVSALRPRGIHLKLLSSADNNFNIGSPILYKKIPVGEILDFFLTDDSKYILFDILIKEKYTNLVNTTTRFYNFSGIDIQANLSGIEVQTGPLSSILNGGISFITPEEGEAVSEGVQFVLYENYEAALHQDSIPITVHLDKTGGVKDKTKITYRGIRIGSILRTRFTPGLREIVAEGIIYREAEDLLRENTSMWLVKPQFGLSGIRHLETALTGPYIDILPGGGNACTDFTLLPELPAANLQTGLNIILETPRLGSLARNSPVYYRQVQVGQVMGFELSPTAQNVWVRVNIRPKYASLIYSGTRFWPVSGIRASWGLFSGFDLSTESMEAIIAGGLAFATPPGEEMGEPAVNGDHFQLQEKSEKSWLDWSPMIMLNEEAKNTGPSE